MAVPKELLDLGIRDYREVFFKPYRIIYRVVESNVYLLLIATDDATCNRCCSGACWAPETARPDLAAYAATSSASAPQR